MREVTMTSTEALFLTLGDGDMMVAEDLDALPAVFFDYFEVEAVA